MKKEWKRLAFVVAAVGLLTTGLLIALFIPRTGWVGFHEHAGGQCPFCGGTGVLDLWGSLATLVILVLMVSIPLSHIAVLVLAVTSIVRSERGGRDVGHDHQAGEGDRSPEGATPQGAPASPHASAGVGLNK